MSLVGAVKRANAKGLPEESVALRVAAWVRRRKVPVVPSAAVARITASPAPRAVAKPRASTVARSGVSDDHVKLVGMKTPVVSAKRV